METMFQTNRLTVRRLQDGDAESLFAIYSDRDAMRWVGDGEPIERDSCDSWIDITLANYQKRGYGMSLISRTSTDELIGFCGLVHPGGQDEAEIKYALARNHWGSGFAFEAARAMVAYGAANFGLRRIIATTAHENAASHRVLEKCGFVREDDRANDDGSSTRFFAWEQDSNAEG